MDEKEDVISIEEVQDILDELAEELPQEFYRELNGGILLLPERRVSNEALAEDLFVMGEYRRSGSMGRYIVIYYGSFMEIYGRSSYEKLKEELRSTLRHEFTHHLEHLAGERGLEIEDAERMARYRRRHSLRRKE